MTDFKIVFPESSLGEVSPAYIESFTFVTDLNKLYAGAKVVFKNFCREAFNEIKTGMKVEFTLKTTGSDEGKSYTNYMRVLSFEKVPNTETSLVDYLNVTLISSWYFVSAIQTKAYQGSIGEIVSSVFTQNFSSENFKTNFGATTDPARIRYQISEKSQDFLKRILKYGTVQNTPLYLYTDAKNTVNLKSLSDSLNGNVSSTLIPDLTETTEKGVSKNTTDIRVSNKVRLKNYKILTENQNSSSRQTTFFTVAGFVASQDVKGSVTTVNAENNNSASDIATPSLVRYMDWSYTPQDAIAIATKDYYEKNLNAFSLVIETDGFALDAIPLGSLNKVILPFKGIKTSSGHEENLGEGGYVVQHLEYIFSDNISSTKALMFLARYN